MTINSLSKTIIDLNKKLVRLYPKKKNYIDKWTMNLYETFIHLMYEDKKSNNNRYPFYEKSVKEESIILDIKKISMMLKENSDSKKLLRHLVYLDTHLKQIQWNLKDCRSSLGKIIDALDKN